MLKRIIAKLHLETVLALGSALILLVHSWAGRSSMNPDGVSYLDIGDSFFRHDWVRAFNAWWSPLYPWVLGSVLGVIHPPAKWEFSVVHFVNFFLALVTLFAFRFFLWALIDFSPVRRTVAEAEDSEPLPRWALVLLGYSIFLWIALEVVTVYDVSPDMLVVASFCLAMGGLLRLRPESQLWKFATWGMVLGVGYWTKAILFPIGIMILVVSLAWHWSSRSWRRGLVAATFGFLCICGPLLAMLSTEKGRFTFGDSGKVAYAWYVSPRTFSRNWQGEVLRSGSPRHPTRQLLQHPPIFEFDGPVVGTYPPWTDPSFWNEGLQWHFELKPQIQVLLGTISSELRLLLRAQPALTVGIIVLAMCGVRSWTRALLDRWPLILISLLSMAAYLPVLENDRYLGGPLLVLFLTLLGAVRLRHETQSTGAPVVIAVFAVMMLGTADYTVRIMTNHLAIPGVGPNSTMQDLRFAEKLHDLGLSPGDKVAIVGDGTGAYWARLAKLRIVAEIMGMNSKDFWDAPAEIKEKSYQAFARTQARLLVGNCPDCPRTALAGWEPVAGTPYCVRWVQPH